MRVNGDPECGIQVRPFLHLHPNVAADAAGRATLSLGGDYER